MWDTTLRYSFEGEFHAREITEPFWKIREKKTMFWEKMSCIKGCMVVSNLNNLPSTLAFIRVWTHCETLLLQGKQEKRKNFTSNARSHHNKCTLCLHEISILSKEKKDLINVNWRNIIFLERKLFNVQTRCYNIFVSIVLWMICQGRFRLHILIKFLKYIIETWI